MPAFIRDRAATSDMLAQLQGSLEFAEYELSMAIEVARNAGFTWGEVAEALGFSSRQGAMQWSQRHAKGTLAGLDDAEYRRLSRLLGIGERVTRFEVREIVSGKPGVTAVKRRTLSTHLSRKVAADRARKRGAGAEVWSVAPDGTGKLLSTVR